MATHSSNLAWIIPWTEDVTEATEYTGLECWSNLSKYLVFVKIIRFIRIYRFSHKIDHI